MHHNLVNITCLHQFYPVYEIVNYLYAVLLCLSKQAIPLNSNKGLIESISYMRKLEVLFPSQLIWKHQNSLYHRYACPDLLVIMAAIKTEARSWY
jgi:hypothetical protein